MRYKTRTFRFFNYRKIPVLRKSIPDLNYMSIPIDYFRQLNGIFLRWQYNKKYKPFGFLVFNGKAFLLKAMIDGKAYEYFVSNEKNMCFETWIRAIQQIKNIEIHNYFAERGELLLNFDAITIRKRNVEKYFLYQTGDSLFFRILEHNIPLLEDIFIEKEWQSKIDVFRLPTRKQFTIKDEAKLPSLIDLPPKQSDANEEE